MKKKRKGSALRSLYKNWRGKKICLKRKKRKKERKTEIEKSNRNGFIKTLRQQKS